MSGDLLRQMHDDDPTGYYARKRAHRAPVAGMATLLMLGGFGAFAAVRFVQAMLGWLA